MKIILKEVTYIIGLYIIETVLLIIFLECSLLFAPYEVGIWNLQAQIRDAWGINGTRLILYGIFQVVMFHLSIQAWNWRRRTLQIALTNSIIYIIISIFYTIVIPGTIEYWTRPFVPLLILSTFLSPFILDRIPFFRIIYSLPPPVQTSALEQ